MPAGTIPTFLNVAHRLTHTKTLKEIQERLANERKGIDEIKAAPVEQQ